MNADRHPVHGALSFEFKRDEVLEHFPRLTRQARHLEAAGRLAPAIQNLVGLLGAAVTNSERHELHHPTRIVGQDALSLLSLCKQIRGDRHVSEPSEHPDIDAFHQELAAGVLAAPKYITTVAA